MREVGARLLAEQHAEMVAAGMTEQDADRVAQARRQALLDGIVAAMAATEHMWTANTFVRGRGVKARNAAAAHADQSARDRSYDSRITAARVESELVASYARPGESREDTVHRLRLANQRAVHILTPTRLVYWDALEDAGHTRVD